MQATSVEDEVYDYWAIPVLAAWSGLVGITFWARSRTQAYLEDAQTTN